MRKIKFRAWDGENMRMLHTRWKMTIWEDGSFSCRHAVTEELINEETSVLMEYVGRKDQHGLDMYEKDIVSYTSFNGIADKAYRSLGVLEYEGEMLTWVLANMDGKKYHVDPYGIFEVIGNVFENPELMKGE